MKQKGFLVKVKGVFALVAYAYMPWTYRQVEYWESIFPTIKNKIFYGNIYYIDNESKVLILNAQIPQFRKVEFLIGKEYNAIIIGKGKTCLIVDLGLHFGWRSGSFVGLLHNTRLKEGETIDSFSVGEIIGVYFLEQLTDRLVICRDDEYFEWYLNKPVALYGKTTWAKVVKSDGEKKYLMIEDKFKSELTIEPGRYLKKPKRIIRRIQAVLKDGDIVNCKVVRANDMKMKIIAYWLPEIDVEKKMSFTMAQLLSESEIQELLNFKDENNNAINNEYTN